MTRRIHKLLYDVWLSVVQMEEFVADIPDFTAYKNNPLAQGAVNWHLIIVGEATNKLRQEDPSVTLPEAKRIVGLRNRLVHAYDDVDDGTVWEILQVHLPALKADVRRRIDEIEAAIARNKPDAE